MHGRDHCPGGSDPIPCLGNEIPYAYIYWNTGGNRTTGVWGRPTPFTNGYVNEAGLVVQGGTANPLLEVVLSGGSGPRIDINHGNGPYGLYMAHAVVSWDTSAAGAFTVGLELGVNGGNSPIASSIQDFRDANILLTNSANGVQYITAPFLFNIGGGSQHIFVSAWHNKGVNLFANYFLLVVYRVETYEVGGGGGQFYP